MDTNILVSVIIVAVVCSVVSAVVVLAAMSPFLLH
jgi:hypothetical protein